MKFNNPKFSTGSNFALIISPLLNDEPSYNFEATYTTGPLISGKIWLSFWGIMDPWDLITILIDSDDILKLTNLAENYNASELADNCLAKNTKKTSYILNENNFSTDDSILIIRILLNKIKRLLTLQEEINKNKSVDEVITNFKPPIFWKEKEIVKKQILDKV